MSEPKPRYWRNKLVCNDCPKLHTCDAVGEWYDPEYSIATYVGGLFDIRYGTKDNKCPYADMRGEENDS